MFYCLSQSWDYGLLSGRGRRPQSKQKLLPLTGLSVRWCWIITERQREREGERERGRERDRGTEGQRDSDRERERGREGQRDRGTERQWQREREREREGERGTEGQRDRETVTERERERGGSWGWDLSLFHKGSTVHILTRSIAGLWRGQDATAVGQSGGHAKLSHQSHRGGGGGGGDVIRRGCKHWHRPHPRPSPPLPAVRWDSDDVHSVYVRSRSHNHWL